MENKDLLNSIKEEGYKYAEYWYSHWYDEFMKDIDADDDSWYKDSLDENGNPILEKFEEQIFEQVNQTFVCDCANNQEMLYELGIGYHGDNIEDLDWLVLYDNLRDGINQFIKEHYVEK